MQTIVDAPDLDQAEELAEKELRKFLRLLSFITNHPYRLSRKIRLIDWPPGLSTREQNVYAEEPPQDPEKALSSGLLDTARLMHSSGTSEPLDRALRWYSAAVASQMMEDQFLFFWFVPELIAVATRSTERVPDKCQQCCNDLYCTTCGQVPTHRPFPKKAIEDLLSRICPDGVGLDQLFIVRNALLHGERERPLKKIRTTYPDVEFHHIVDMAGKLAWTAILNAFRLPPGTHQPEFLMVNTYVNWKLTAKAHITIGTTSDPNKPRLEDVGSVEISIVPADASDE